jgi:hypothetical protein
MAIDTKPNLNSCKFEQCVSDVMNLSGCTQIYGQLDIENGATLSICGGAGVGKVLVSDASGVATWQEINVSASGDAIKKQISQSSHGFSVQDVIGWSGGTYNKAIADGTYDGEVLGIVSSVPNINAFELTQAGYITGLTSLVQSTTYFLSDSTPGLLTATEPTGDTHISKAMLLADSTTSGWVLPYAGYIITTGDTASIVVDTELNTGSTNPVQNQAIAIVINQILGVIAEPPVYTAPTANLTAGLTQTVEMGATVTNATANISFTQNDAGTATGYELCRNGSNYSNNMNNLVTDTNITSAISYVGKVSYACGVTKDNNLGIPDPTGKIVAGTVSSPTRTITPVLKQFWGSTTAVPTTSTDVRSLSNNNFATVNSFNLTTGTVNKIFAVAIPSTKSITSVIDTGNLNLNITSEYALINGSFTVKDAGNNDRTYKLYAMQADTPYPTSTTHAITVS